MSQTWSRGYKPFFMLNSAVHEVLNAHMYKNIRKSAFFSGSDKLIMLFFLLINVKMPTLLLINVKMLAFWHFNIYEKEN